MSYEQISMLAPITLFTYARPEHTRRTVESLLQNIGANEYDLIVYSDAARSLDKAQDVAEVRAYLQTIVGFRSVTIIHRLKNYGLSKSIIHGVTEVLMNHRGIIVLEDDMVTSPHFLTYMSQSLNKYENDDRVISVHGYIYPVKVDLPETFFLRGADCWGWATWQRGWVMFNPDGQYLLDELRRKNITNQFNFQGAYNYTQMLEDQINGKNDSWAIRWHASAFLANKLTLYPGKSLVHNIGNDSSGTHCGTTKGMDVELSSRPICLQNVIVEESTFATKAVQEFFQSKRTRLGWIFSLFIPDVINQELWNFIKNSLPPAMVGWLRRF